MTLLAIFFPAPETLLPELAASVVTAAKKNAVIAIGKAVGANIFKIFFVLGISAMIKSTCINNPASAHIGVVVAGAVLLIGASFIGKSTYRAGKKSLYF